MILSGWPADRPAETSAYFVHDAERQQPIVIPHRELSAAALRGVLESFVLREGTDYGEAQIIFDAALVSIDIVVSKDR